MKLLKIKNPLEKDKEVKDAIDEALISLKKDKDVYPVLLELGLSKKEVKDGLAILMEYQNDFHVCQNCPGLDACPKEHPGYKMEISRLRGSLHQNMLPCNLKEKADRESAKYSIRDFPDEWLNAGLKNVDKSASTRNPVLEQMVLTIKEPSSKWIYIHGREKMGKSYLMAAFANDFAKINKCLGVAFINTQTVFDQLKSQSLSFDDKWKFSQNMDLLKTCPLLVLDDFGEEFQTKYIFEVILEPLIKARNEAGLPTAFASRFSLESVLNGYKRKVAEGRVEELISVIRNNIKADYDITGVALYS